MLTKKFLTHGGIVMLMELVNVSKFQTKEVNKFKVLLFLSFSKYIIPINFKKKFAELLHLHLSFISIHTYLVFEVNN